MKHAFGSCAKVWDILSAGAAISLSTSPLQQVQHTGSRRQILNRESIQWVAGQPRQVLTVRGRQLPRLFHEIAVVLCVEYLRAVVLLDIDGRFALLAQPLFLQYLHLHAEGWCKGPPGACQRGVLTLFGVEEASDRQGPCAANASDAGDNDDGGDDEIGDEDAGPDVASVGIVQT